MADNVEDFQPTAASTQPKPSTKHHLWRLGAYLTPFVYAAVLLVWPHSLPAWLVILAGIFVLSLFVTAGLLHIRDIGGWKRLEAYVHHHLWSSVAVIAVFCCLILGTVVYLAVRPPHHTAPPTAAKVTAPPTTTAQTTTEKPPAPAAPLVRPNKPMVKHSPTSTPNTRVPAQTPAETPSPQNPQPTPPPTYQQQCVGSACAQGPGAQATYIGNIPPPVRHISPDNVAKAVALLKQSKQGSMMYLITYPTQAKEGGEISNFATELENAFGQGGWIAYRDRDVHLGSASILEEGNPSTGEDGIGCTSPNPPTEATAIARKALALLGYPCMHMSIWYPQSFQSDTKLPYALYVSVGTRIEPER